MKKYLPLILITPTVILLDQWTKWLIKANLALGSRVVVWEGFFEIVHVRNKGAAFGVLSNWDSSHREWFFYAISLIALIALTVLYVKSKPRERRIQIPLALILGGALGNLLDRLYQGDVVDFLHFHWHNQMANFTVLGKQFRFLLSWPSFNVADIAITCGAIYLALVILFFDRKPKTP